MFLTPLAEVTPAKPMSLRPENIQSTNLDLLRFSIFLFFLIRFFFFNFVYETKKNFRRRDSRVQLPRVGFT